MAVNLRHACKVARRSLLGFTSATVMKRKIQAAFYYSKAGAFHCGRPSLRTRSTGRATVRRAEISERRSGRFGCSFQYFTIAANDFGSSDAPPTNAPSISSCDMSAFALSGFTDPP